MHTRLIAAAVVALAAGTAYGQDSTTPPPTPVVPPQVTVDPKAATTAVERPPVDVPPYHVGRLAYDRQCMTIDGKDVVLFSGAFHYFRCPKPLWADRFRTLKAAGFNCVETYVAWNWHEQVPPASPDDFSKLDMTDLHDWLEMATEQFGMQVVLRPGPYICAEWDGGGYPQWLLNRRPADYKPKLWLRSDDPVYLAWCKHWYAAVAKVAVPYQVTHRPAGHAGIVLWQTENEYDYAAVPTAQKLGQLRFLAATSKGLGIDVPLHTCMTNAPQVMADPVLRAEVVSTVNSYPGFDMGGYEGALDWCRQRQPEKFRMVTELQGGWFAQVGGKLSDQQGHNAAQINQITLLAYAHGFTATNYYMAFGGTNLGDWPSQSLIQSYDYNAPVREPGGTGDRYLAVKAIGQFVAEHGADLARTELADAEVRGLANDVKATVRRGRAGDYVFVSTTQRGGTRSGPLGVTIRGDHPRTIKAKYDLGDFGAKVLFVPNDGRHQVWYPKPQDGPRRPAAADLPAAVTITDARVKVDPGPNVWHPFDPAKTAAECGIYNRGVVFYKGEVPTASSADGAVALAFDLAGKDAAVVAVGGHRVRPDANGAFPLAGQTNNGGLTAMVLYANAGRPNFGDSLEQPSGLLRGRVTASAEPPVALSGWRVHPLDRPAGKGPVAEVASDVDDGAWPAADVSADAGDLAPGATAVYRATVMLTDAQAGQPRTLTLGSIDDDGMVYVNGQPAAESHEWSTPVHADVGKLLHPGRNTVAVVVHNRDGAGGLCRGAMLAATGKPMPTQWSLSQDGQGSLNHWDSNGFDDRDWKAAKLDGSPAPADDGALLTWTRMRFELPTAKPGLFAPWRATLDCTGNGFVYLNGHALGRWWEVGPQRDYYLPECWLNTGPGQANVLTVALHPTDHPAAVKAAVVQVYADQAEVR